MLRIGNKKGICVTMFSLGDESEAILVSRHVHPAYDSVSFRSTACYRGDSLRNKRRFGGLGWQLFYETVPLPVVPSFASTPRCTRSPSSGLVPVSSRYVIIMSGETRIPRKVQRRNAAAVNSPRVILPLMILGCFCVSAMVAMGIVQFSTGPQKYVLKKVVGFP